MNLDSLRVGIRYSDAGITTRSYFFYEDILHHYKATTMYLLVSDLVDASGGFRGLPNYNVDPDQLDIH